MERNSFYTYAGQLLRILSDNLGWTYEELRQESHLPERELEDTMRLMVSEDMIVKDTCSGIEKYYPKFIFYYSERE